MRSRRDMPRYAQYSPDCIHLSYTQFKHICKGRVPRWANEMGRDEIRVTRTKDGIYWGEWRGQACFWASRWYQIPKAVGQRAEKIRDFVEAL